MADDGVRTDGVRYQLLLRHHPHPVVLLDERGWVLEANPAAHGLLIRCGAPSVGASIEDVVVPAEGERLSAALAAASQQGTSTLDLEARDVAGVHIDLRATLIAVQSPGPVTTTLVVIEDVSAVRGLQRQLAVVTSLAAAAARARQDFVARANHEIRTPLTSILATTDLLVTTTDPHLQQQLTSTLQRASRRLLRLIENVLDFSSPEQAAGGGVTEEFDLHVLVQDAISLVRAPARSKGLLTSCRIDDDVPRLVRDHPTWTTQILDNLLANAVSNTEAGRVDLAVSLTRSATSDVRVVYCITDTGAGIATEHAELVFEPFERGARNGDGEGSGLGLGLSIVKHLVELSNGTITLTTAPGSGTTVTVVLPLQVPEH